MTGVFLDQADISGKWLELVGELVPKLARVAATYDVTTPADQLRALQATANALKIDIRAIDVRNLQDFEAAFAEAGRGRAQAVVLLSSPLVSRHGRRLAELAAAKRLPIVSMFKENAAEGCLMAYGPTLVEMYRIAGHLAGRILKRGQAWRASDRAADATGVRTEPEDSQDAFSCHPASTAGSGGSGHRMNGPGALDPQRERLLRTLFGRCRARSRRA